jgi:hypothetical protein
MVLGCFLGAVRLYKRGMEFEAVKTWLTGQTQKQIRNRWWLAFLGLLLLPIATAAGGGLIYILLLAFTRRSEDPQIGIKCLWIALGILLVMFVVNFFIPRNKEEETFYSEDEGAPDSLVGAYVHRRKVQGKFLLWIMLTGPRLLSWSVDSFKEISRLKQRDTHSCAALLWLLMTKRKKVPYEDISQELDWLNLEATLVEIQRIPGVLFLKTPPEGLSLTDDLRAAIRTGGDI